MKINISFHVNNLADKNSNQEQEQTDSYFLFKQLFYKLIRAFMPMRQLLIIVRTLQVGDQPTLQ